MATLILGGSARYVVVADHRATPFALSELKRFGSAIFQKTGAQMPCALYDENGTLRELFDFEGKRVMEFSRGGALKMIYDQADQKLARYDAEGELCLLYWGAPKQNKAVARVTPDGRILAVLDTKERLLAELDAAEEIVAVYHKAGDLLSEADEEYAEYFSDAQVRLAAARESLSLLSSRREEAETLLATVREAYEAEAVILCGRIQGNALSARAHENLSPTAYAISFVGKTITVAAFTESLLGRALKDLLERLEEKENGFVLADSTAVVVEDSRVATVLPTYQTENGVFEGSYYCGDENYELCFSSTTCAEYEAYLDELFARGFTVYDENTIADCRFGTYLAPDERAGEIVVFVSYFPALARTQIVFGPRAYLPATEQPQMPAEPIATTLTQPYRMCVYNGNMGDIVRGAPGMSYVVQLADGSFIVIDGGPRDGKVIPKVCKKGEWIDLPETQSNDAQALFEMLCEMSPEEKPKIAAWFITHPHSDHMALANQFLEEYAGKVDIELAAFNFPDFDTVYCKNESPTMNHKRHAAPFREKIREIYGAKECVIHTGQRFYFAGCEIEILMTQEEHYPISFMWGNHMSCAFRMKFAEKTAMMLGDCEKNICQRMSDCYGKELKSDILQLTHHGSNGACLDINYLVDPDICLWAIDGYRFSTDERMMGKADGYAFNRILRDKSVRVREHYHCDETVTLKV